MPSILVVGGAGYIGSHTVKHLLDNGYAVTVVDNLACGHQAAIDKRASFVRADLLEPASLARVFDSHKMDAVIHFAAFTSVEESMRAPQKYYVNNVVGTIHLLRVMLEHDVRNIVFSSTCATYGAPQYIPMDERHPQNPLNPYGRTKLLVEQILADYAQAYGLRYMALRYFNAAGAAADGSLGESHLPETHVIPRLLQTIRGEYPFFNILGNDYDTPDGTCIRDYIHVEDLALAHRLALEKLPEYTGCINLGTGVGTSVREMILSAEEVTGRKCPIKYVARRAGDAPRLLADNRLARKVLGWQPMYTQIKNIIQTAWNWEQHRKY